MVESARKTDEGRRQRVAARTLGSWPLGASTTRANAVTC
jgi:hypothetical protein